MKKLLIISSNSMHTYNYIELIKDYFDEILLLSNEKNNDYGVPTIEIDFHLNVNMFKSIKQIKKIFYDFNPSIVHVHQANSYAFLTFLALKKINVPKVLTAWGSDILLAPKESYIYKLMLKFNLSQADVVTSDSLFMAQEMKSYNSKLDIRISSYGIEDKERNIDKVNIIYSNRLHMSLYNIDKILYAFKEFVKVNTDWKLVIGATGESTQRLKQLTSDLNMDDKVEFIGWVDTTTNNQMYQKAKIYISIPSSDATSISLLEAIANNCICFVSNVPANYEHILDGINGFIEPNLDSIDLEKYKDIDYNILSQVNEIRKTSYTKDKNREKFLEIYDEVLEGYKA